MAREFIDIGDVRVGERLLMMIAGGGVGSPNKSNSDNDGNNDSIMTL